MLEKLKGLLGLTGEEQDEKLQGCLDTVVQRILNYCNLETLPQALEDTAVRMAAQYWQRGGSGPDAGSAGGAGGVSAVKRGDMSVSFFASGAEIKENSGGTAALLDEFRTQLQEFRKVRW